MQKQDFSPSSYELIRSKRRTVSISISRELRVVVRAPVRTSKSDIDAIVCGHSAWIAKHTDIMRQRLEQPQVPALTAEQTELLRHRAKELLPKRVEHFAGIMGVAPAGITVTAAKTRWGSCSAKDKLSFSYRLMLLPDEQVDYIVVHELAHIREKNHSPRFYAVVERYMPDYKERQARLRELQASLPV